MRQLLIHVPRGEGDRALGIAQEHRGSNLAKLEAQGPEGPVDVVIVHISNRTVGELLDALEVLPNLKVTLVPREVIALQPPPSEAPNQVTDVAPRSPVEILLAGLQSIGSWKGFLSYAASAGVVVWIGLFTNTIYLLTASMLIAPFAGPAMNMAIGTARGDRVLITRSLGRYLSALGVTIACTFLLSLITQQQIATQLMIDNSQVSAAAILLPLVAGAAGAMNLIQSERSSLVSGAAVGMLVAASLAPPAGIIGMALAMGEWDMAKNGLFLLILQLAGINLAGSGVFRAFGLSPTGVRYPRGKRWVGWVSTFLTIGMLAGLLGWQFRASPELERSTVSQQVATEIRQIVRESALADPLEIDVRFARADTPGPPALLGEVFVRRRSDRPVSEIRATLTQRIQAQLQQRFNVTPLLDVTVLEGPP